MSGWVQVVYNGFMVFTGILFLLVAARFYQERQALLRRRRPRPGLADILTKPMGFANTATILPGWQGNGLGLFG